MREIKLKDKKHSTTIDTYVVCITKRDILHLFEENIVLKGREPDKPLSLQVKGIPVDNLDDVVCTISWSYSPPERDLHVEEEIHDVVIPTGLVEPE